jgi:CBS domain-containing protein
MSPRAAGRLETLGFNRVYDYTLGIADWKGAGLAVEGTATGQQLVADATRRDVPTCTPEEPIGEAWSRTSGEGWDECIVVDCGGIVVGRIRGSGWETDSGTLAELAMEPGPTTVRPNSRLKPLVDRMGDRGTKLVVVTNAQGELVGVLLRQDAERIISGEPPEEVWRDCEGCPGRWALGDGESSSPGHSTTGV